MKKTGLLLGLLSCLGFVLFGKIFNAGINIWLYFFIALIPGAAVFHISKIKGHDNYAAFFSGLIYIVLLSFNSSSLGLTVAFALFPLCILALEIKYLDIFTRICMLAVITIAIGMIDSGAAIICSLTWLIYGAVKFRQSKIRIAVLAITAVSSILITGISNVQENLGGFEDGLPAVFGLQGLYGLGLVITAICIGSIMASDIRVEELALLVLLLITFAVGMEWIVNLTDFISFEWGIFITKTHAILLSASFAAILSAHSFNELKQKGHNFILIGAYSLIGIIFLTAFLAAQDATSLELYYFDYSLILLAALVFLSLFLGISITASAFKKIRLYFTAPSPIDDKSLYTNTIIELYSRKKVSYEEASMHLSKLYSSYDIKKLLEKAPDNNLEQEKLIQSRINFIDEMIKLSQNPKQSLKTEQIIRNGMRHNLPKDAIIDVLVKLGYSQAGSSKLYDDYIKARPKGRQLKLK